jgi:hypothetical protein
MESSCFRKPPTVSYPSTPLAAELDHLVIVAASLEEGVQWCERTLGITPGPGGEHPLMGTHNRLFNISGPVFRRSYAEIIAVHPGATFTRAATGQKRWFDMDDALLKARVVSDGPQLLHFVASVSGVGTTVRALAALRLDRGPPIEASRQTARGLLSWRITVRDDGQRLFFGGLPTLIQWGDASEKPEAAMHPVDSMGASGVLLESLQFSHPLPESLKEAYGAIGLSGVDVMQGAPNLVAILNTPRGIVKLQSHGH